MWVGDLRNGLRVLKWSYRSSCGLKGYSFCYIFISNRRAFILLITSFLRVNELFE